MVTLKYPKVVALGEKAPFREGQAMSEGSEQKETYTHSSFPLSKHGIAYPSRGARRRNPHCNWLLQ